MNSIRPKLSRIPLVQTSTSAYSVRPLPSLSKELRSPSQLHAVAADCVEAINFAPRRFVLCALLATAFIVTPKASAQVATEGSGEVPASTASKTDPSILTLNPFTVNAEKDRGFIATNAGTATKLGLDMKDMAAPYSVMTGEFIKALGLTDVDALTLSMTRSVATGTTVDAAARAIAIGIAANSLMKAGIAFSVGSPGFRWPAGMALILMAAAGIAALVLL